MPTNLTRSTQAMKGGIERGIQCQPVSQAPLGEGEYSRQSGDAEGLHDVSVLIRIYLREFEHSFGLDGRSLQLRPQLLARSAPVGISEYIHSAMTQTQTSHF